MTQPGRIRRRIPRQTRVVLDGPSLRGRVAAAELEARQRAEGVLRGAERRARHILDDATRSAAEARLDAEAAGRAKALAEFAAQSLELRARLARAQEATLETTTDLARILAERLIGEALRLEPRTVVALAQQVLREARGAAAVTLACHPDDAPALQNALGATEGLSLATDPDLARGDLRLDTDVGRIEARIGAQLAVLAVALQRSLRS